MASLEKAILSELKLVTKNNKLRLKDIMEWSTSVISPREDEEVFFLPELRVWCAIRRPKGG